MSVPDRTGDKKMHELLEKSALFKGLMAKEIECVLSKIVFERQIYKRGDTGYSETSFKNKVVIVLSGTARVEKNHEDGSRIFMRRLKAGDVYGILAICSETPLFPTMIIFEKSSEVLLLSEESLLILIQNNQDILKNYLTFWSSRVNFLFERISLFTTSLVEKKLLLYLEQQSERLSSTSFILPYSKVELAEYLGVGRSSLYRAFDKLSNERFITIIGKEIKILRR